MLGVWLRRWRRNPLLAVQIFATIALGMAAVTAVVSLLLAMAFQPLPFRDPGQIVQLWNRVESGAPVHELSGAEVVEIQEATQDLFAHLGGFYVFPFWILGEGADAEPLHVARLEEAAFRALELTPILGSPVNANAGVAIGDGLGPVWISSRLWQARFGGRPSVIGETIRLAQNEAGLYESRARVAGVMPPNVRVPHPRVDGPVDVWAILPSQMTRQAARAEVFLALGRLRHDHNVADAQAQLSALADRRQESEAQRRRPVVQTFEEILLGPARRTAGVLSVGVALVLVLAFANLASLVVAEAWKRRLDFAIRSSLGATRRQLWWDVVGAHSALILCALAVGLPLAWLALRGLTELLTTADLGPPLSNPPSLNLSVMVGFVICALAAIAAWATSIVRSLGSGNPGVLRTGSTDPQAASPRVGLLRLGALSTQVCLGVALIVLAVSLTGAYVRLTAVDLGPAPDRTAFFSARRSTGEPPTSAQAADFNARVLSSVQRLPGIEAVGFVDVFPPLGAPASFWKHGDPPESPRQATLPSFVSDDYFRTLDIPILFGRGFTDADRGGGHPVAIIDLEMARRNWASPADALNAQIRVRSNTAIYEVIGVAGSFSGYWARTPMPTIYLSQNQFPSNGGVAILRIAADSSTSSVTEHARQMLLKMAGRPSVSKMSTLQAEWQATSSRPRARMSGMLALGLIGLLLGVQGVYALSASLIASRRQELAIRTALGASRAGLIWLVLRQVTVAVLTGSVAGALTIMAVHRFAPHWISASVSDPAASISLGVAILMLSALLGGYVPARAATRAIALPSLLHR